MGSLHQLMRGLLGLACPQGRQQACFFLVTCPNYLWVCCDWQGDEYLQNTHHLSNHKNYYY